MSLTIPSPANGLRLLSFDGGGIRAISQALMIKEIMHRVKEDHQLQRPPQVSDYFDMVCGSGLGGLLAIMCGVLHMTGDQLVEESVGLCKAIFSGEFDTTQRTAALEDEMKRLIIIYCSGEGEGKMIKENDTCKTFVCAASSHNAIFPRLFRNYRSRSNPSPDCTILEASRATTAMPDLFDPITIEDKHISETFVGGELRWNNPSDELTKEAARVFKGRHIACIISIGSGHPTHLSLSAGLADLLPRIALDCERLADDMERRFGSAPDVFWRLSVEQGLQNLEVDLLNLEELASHTHSYLQNARTNRDMDTLLLDLVHRPERIPINAISGEVSIKPKILEPKICPRPSQYFTGRRVVMEQLEEYYILDGEVCRVAVLYGIGGGGKTQIGLEFVQRYRTRFNTVFFIDGSSKLTLENDLAAIAVGTSDQPSFNDGTRILRSRCEEWLLFIDNADDPVLGRTIHSHCSRLVIDPTLTTRDHNPRPLHNPSLDLHPYVSWPHGNVLITTRNREVCAHAPKCSIWVDRLDLEDAKELLLRGVPVEKNLGAQEVALAIVKELGCLALAISQARAFLAKGLCTLAEYLPMYKQNRWQLLEEQSIQKTDDYQYSIYTTWTISFNKLSPDAALLLEFVSFMHHETIPACLFEDAWKVFAKKDEGAVLPMVSRFLSSFTAVGSAWNILRFRKLIGEILSFSLFEFSSARNTFSLHPLVQQWAQSHVEDYQEILCASQTLLSLAIPAMDTSEAYAAKRALIPHLRDSLMLESLLHYTLLSEVGSAFRDAGLLRESCQVFRRELLEMQAAVGNEHPNTLTSMSNLALTYFDLGQHQDAQTLHEQVLKGRRRTLGNEHQSTLKSMNNLALAYSGLGRYRDALKLHKDELGLCRQICGEEHPDTLISMNNLAITYSCLGHRILGDTHLDTLSTTNDLALSFSNLGQYQDVLEFSERVLTLCRQVLGEEHPDTLKSMNSLAFTYLDLGQYHHALELHKQVLQLRRQALGEEHPDTLKSMNNLALTCSHLGQHQEASELRERVLKLRSHVLGDDHPETLTTMNDLALTYSRFGRYREALKLHEQVLRLRKQISGDKHPHTLISMDNLALTYSKLGQYQAALELYEQVLKQHRQVLGDEHPDTLKTMNNLALTYSNLGQYRDALELHERVFDARRRVFGDEHPQTALSLSRVEHVRAEVERNHLHKPMPQRKRDKLKHLFGVTGNKWFNE
ncbi:hypothetical protein DL96DRAFT_1821248 [Flagelloscypha sp. PMI_526]|nr:hypothetical protein DL96DRAFT_1821248 [Flagelloscypha sp. PMI_526]